MTDLAGTLLSIGLTPLLGFLSQLRKTGSLFISDGPLSGQVFLEGGRVVGAVFGAERGSAAFEAIVLVLGGGEFELDEAIAERELNFMVDPKVLDDHLRRLSEERARFANILPSLAVVPSLSLSGAPSDEVTVNVAALRLLLEVDGRRSVLDLARDGGLVAAARGVARLVELGLVTVKPIYAASTTVPGTLPAIQQIAPGRLGPAPGPGRPTNRNTDVDHPTRRWFDGRGPGHA
jgi:hypothetical protein